MMNAISQIQNIIFQLKNLEMQFENINFQIQNMVIQNLCNQLQNLGMQMLNMGIQIINIGIEIPNFGLENPNISQQLKDIGNQIQNIGMNMDMKKGLQMNLMMMNNNYNKFEDNKWNLIFEEKTPEIRTFAIQISPDKNFEEAINMYKIKSSKYDNNIKMRFIWNGMILHPEMTISKIGFSNDAKISVIFMNDVIGG